ncbi:hypothetical protein BV898_17755 [Hypsibius exemplaris]|uniref:Uncharacterized protein n=1 Tax=Hypsibius exemplaris TaxID=2072580 RepID=A0A9X6NG64_HYPEX|nr:hypothetical protein BV898_17755 [Hypsibius exemplaris]
MATTSAFPIFVDTAEPGSNSMMGNNFKKPLMKERGRLHDSSQKMAPKSNKNNTSLAKRPTSSDSRSESSSSSSVSSTKGSKDAKTTRQQEIAAIVENTLNAHPEEFSQLGEVGHEPDTFTETAEWMYPQAKLNADLDAINRACSEVHITRKRRGLGGFRDVTNIGFEELLADVHEPEIPLMD